jgi:ABC-2 type transport system ATP-binding protein
MRGYKRAIDLMTQPAITVDSLSKKFGAFTAVDNVSFDVNRGEVLGFLGPNGAGKSTTMKMITGFLAPSGGKIHVDGMDVSRYPTQVKQRIGYLPEGAPAYGDMTVTGFLGFIADIRGYRGAEKQDRIQSAIQKVNLGSVIHTGSEPEARGARVDQRNGAGQGHPDFHAYPRRGECHLRPCRDHCARAAGI